MNPYLPDRIQLELFDSGISITRDQSQGQYGQMEGSVMISLSGVCMLGSRNLRSWYPFYLTPTYTD